jgi:hypothetical protein
MNLKGIEKRFGLLIGFLLFALFSFPPALFGACDPAAAAGFNNSGTVSGAGPGGSLGTNIGIGDNTTVATAVPPASPASPAKPDAKGYNPLEDPNLTNTGKPVDTKAAGDLGDKVQQQLPGGKPQDTTGTLSSQPPISIPGGEKPPAGGDEGSTTTSSVPTPGQPGVGYPCYDPNGNLYYSPTPCPQQGQSLVPGYTPPSGEMPGKDPGKKDPGKMQKPMPGKTQKPMPGKPKPPAVEPGQKPGQGNCGPGTYCKCADGRTGHIPCDKSMGRCHCGGG